MLVKMSLSKAFNNFSDCVEIGDGSILGRFTGVIAWFLDQWRDLSDLYISGKVASVNERLASLQIIGPKTSLQSLIRDASMKSSGDVFSGQLFMTFRVSISVTLPK
jgi:hypothetical protein